MKPPTQLEVQKTLITRFGLDMTVGFYLKNANDAAQSLEIAIGDKNALAMAKHARDLAYNTRIAYSILTVAKVSPDKK